MGERNMANFISSLSEVEIIRILVQRYGIKHGLSLESVYKATCLMHEQKPLGYSNNETLKKSFDGYVPEKGLMRFKLPFTFAIAEEQNLFWIMQPPTFRWSTLKNLIIETKPHTAMLLAPIGWQLGPLFFNECDKEGVIAATFDSVNASSADLVLKNHPIELLVTTSSSLQQLLELRSPLPKHVLLITAFGETPFLLQPDNVQVRHDLHLKPGIPIAYSETHSIGEQFTFSTNPDYMIVEDNQRYYVTSLADNVLNLFHFPLEPKLQVINAPDERLTLAYV